MDCGRECRRREGRREKNTDDEKESVEDDAARRGALEDLRGREPHLVRVRLPIRCAAAFVLEVATDDVNDERDADRSSRFEDE